MPLNIGDSAPNVVLPSHEMTQVSLGELYPGQNTVIVFFPLAFSSTCTEELCTLRDDLAAYGALNAQVVAISVDSPYVLKRYREELGAEFLFLSDFNRLAAPGFGVLREATTGPGLLHTSERAVFVVDPGGAVRYVWCGAHPGLLPPFDEIKDALTGLAPTAG